MSYIALSKDNRSPSLTDTITIDGTAADLTGATVKLKMREQTTGTLTVDAAATVLSPSAGTVRYDWAAADVDTAGEYAAWWEVTLAGGKKQDTPEFRVTIVAHSPASFAEPFDLEDRLGITFTTDETARARKLLAQATEVIKSKTGQTIALVEDDEINLPGAYGTTIRLPQRPIVEVSSVVLEGTELSADAWYVDGDRLVRSGVWPASEMRFGIRGAWGAPSESVVVTYTHGWSTIPGIVKVVCLEMASRVWVNPGNTTQQHIGNTRADYAATGLLMTKDEEASVNEVVRRQSGSMVLR